MDEDLGVAELIMAIRYELANLESRLHNENLAPLFQLEHVDLAVTFTATKRKEGQAGIDLKVITVGGSTAIESAEVQTLNVRYTVDPAARRMGIPGARAHGSSRQEDIVDVEPLE
jgi:hypothetical protein